jgi:hypothetical protein
MLSLVWNTLEYGEIKETAAFEIIGTELSIFLNPYAQHPLKPERRFASTLS